MKLYAPKYYNDFKCIADKCTHSCCIGWEIDIDGHTYEKYSSLDSGYGKIIKDSVDTEGVPHFRLRKNDLCPHLNEKGLCNIILEMGEDMLCEICREHPRFYNDVGGHKEVGIGMSCEEAARMILQSDCYDDIIEIGDIDFTAENCSFDARFHRNKVYSILHDYSLSYRDRLSKIGEQYGVSLSVLSGEEWAETIDSLEYLDEKNKELFNNFSPNTDTPQGMEKYLERAFAYFVFRHCSPSQNEDDFAAGLGLSLFCERLFASIISAQKTQDFETVVFLARTVSEEIEYSIENTDCIKCIFLF